MSASAQSGIAAPTPLQTVARLRGALRGADLRPVVGRVGRVSGTIIEASLQGAAVGELCALGAAGDSGAPLLAEVVGLRDGVALLSAMGEIDGVSTRTQVRRTGRPLTVPVGEALLGRVLDGLARPLDSESRGPLLATESRPVTAAPPDPLARAMIEQHLALGIPAIDATMTCGRGQRIGLFGEPGVGKSTLMSAIARAASADVAVIALVGERGREVSEFVEDALGPEGLRKSVVIAATSDRPAMERLKAPFVATAIAEYFRDQGKTVVLLMDSLTRLARAQREIGLAAGEPPARRAFPPSVFALMPKLIERAGPTRNGGSITAFYTVLMEDDGVGDPVAEEARALLDGHIILSRKIAESGKYPAIDVLASRSRVMTRVTTRRHQRQADHIRALMARRRDADLLIRMGEYKRGSDALTDEAIAKNTEIEALMHRDLHAPLDWAQMLQRLSELAPD